MRQHALEEHTETTEDTAPPLLRDAPCVRCGHPAHIYLPCGGQCDCEPTTMPGG